MSESEEGMEKRPLIEKVNIDDILSDDKRSALDIMKNEREEKARATETTASEEKGKEDKIDVLEKYRERLNKERERFTREWREKQAKLREWEERLREKEKALNEKEARMENQLKNEKLRLNKEQRALSEEKARLLSQEKKLRQKGNELSDLEKSLKIKDALLKNTKKELKEKEESISEREKLISGTDEEIEKLRNELRIKQAELNIEKKKLDKEREFIEAKLREIKSMEQTVPLPEPELPEPELEIPGISEPVYPEKELVYPGKKPVYSEKEPVYHEKKRLPIYPEEESRPLAPVDIGQGHAPEGRVYPEEELTGIDDLMGMPEERAEKKAEFLPDIEEGMWPAMEREPGYGAERRVTEPPVSSPSTPVASSPPVPVDDVVREIEGYRHSIDDFRARGYNVSRLYGIFSMDIDVIRKEVLEFMEDVRRLKELENELRKLDTSKFEKEVGYLRTLLKNPDAVKEAESYFEDLKARILNQEKEGRERKSREIEELFDDVLKEYEKEAEAHADEIEDIKASLIDMERMPMENLFALKKKVKRLKDTLERDRRREKERKRKIAITTDLREWSERGFNVSRIEALLDRDLREASELYMDFLPKAERLLKLERELQSLDTTGFERQVDEIMAEIHNPDKVLEVEKNLESLKRRIRLSNIQKAGREGKKLAKPAMGRTGPTEMTCPKCGGVVPIPSDERPLRVRCSNCGTEFTLKRIPVPEEQPTQAPGAQMPPPPVSSGAPLPAQTPPPPNRVPAPPASTYPQAQMPQAQPAPQPGYPQAQTAPAPLPNRPPPPPAAGYPQAPPQQAPPIPPPNRPPAPPAQYTTPSKAPETPARCPRCGAEILPGSKFCGVCGYPIE